MNGGGKRDNKKNRRWSFGRRDKEQSEARSGKPEQKWTSEIGRDKAADNYERLKWSPPQLSTIPIPASDCMYCGKAIKDMSSAISDKNSGAAIHFDCVITRISQGEKLGPGDSIAYIGGGRFGIVNYKNPANSHSFVIKKIFEWEIRENRAEWRQIISDHYSLT